VPPVGCRGWSCKLQLRRMRLLVASIQPQRLCACVVCGRVVTQPLFEHQSFGDTYTYGHNAMPANRLGENRLVASPVR
jgi:hypothetical protein